LIPFEAGGDGVDLSTLTPGAPGEVNPLPRGAITVGTEIPPAMSAPRPARRAGGRHRPLVHDTGSRRGHTAEEKQASPSIALCPGSRAHGRGDGRVERRKTHRASPAGPSIHSPAGNNATAAPRGVPHGAACCDRPICRRSGSAVLPKPAPRVTARVAVLCARPSTAATAPRSCSP